MRLAVIDDALHFTPARNSLGNEEFIRFACRILREPDRTEVQRHSLLPLCIFVICRNYTEHSLVALKLVRTFRYRSQQLFVIRICPKSECKAVALLPVTASQRLRAFELH